MLGGAGSNPAGSTAIPFFGREIRGREADEEFVTGELLKVILTSGRWLPILDLQLDGLVTPS